jgi:ABC-type multidrug transport system permease subunit
MRFKPGRFISILIKEYRHIVREPRTLWMIFLSPAFVLIALSFLFASGSNRVDLAVWDHDRTPMSREFASNLDSNPDFSVTYVNGYEEIDDLLVDQDVDAAVVIPAGFGNDIHDSDGAPVQVILDGVDTFAAGQATGGLLGYSSAFGLRLSQQFSLPAPALQVYAQHAYSSDTEKQDGMIPALIPLVFSLPAMAAALALTKEKETKTLESLVVTPVRPLEYLSGKLVAYVTTALVGLLPAWFVATVVFGVPFRGNPVVFVLATVTFLLANMGLAIFMGNLVHSQQTATVIALFVFFVPGFFLAGLIDPIDTTKIISTGVSHILPTTHFVTISRAVFVKGAGLSEIWSSMAGLLGIAAVWLGLGALTFRKRTS